MGPLFSVIVPVYKAELYLRECIDSVLAQSFADFELILVDDGSPDGCPAICDEYACTDSRVSVIHQKNGGHTSARNAGAAAAAGKYICFADSDDYVEPDWLQTVSDDIAANDSPDMLVYSYFENTDSGQRTVPQYLPAGHYGRQQLEEKVFPFMLYDPRRREFGLSGISNNIWTKPMKRELYEKWKLTDERITVAEDSCVSFTALCHADSVYLSDTPLYHYRIRPASITTETVLPKKTESLFLAAEYLRSHISGTPARYISVWIMKQLTRVIYSDCARSSFSDSVRHIRIAFSGRGAQLRAIQPAGFPLPSRLLLCTLRLRLYVLTALLNRMLQRARR